MQYHCMINAMTQKDYFDLIIFMNLYQGMSASVEGTVNPVMNVDWTMIMFMNVISRLYCFS